MSMTAFPQLCRIIKRFLELGRLKSQPHPIARLASFSRLTHLSKFKSTRSILVSVCIFKLISAQDIHIFSLYHPVLNLKDMSMVEVKVWNLDCEGCVAKIHRALHKVKGVEEIEIEMEMQKVTVRGHRLEEKKVLKAVKRAGKAAEPWPFPSHSHYASFYKYPAHIVSHYYETSCRNATGAHTFFHTPSTYSVAVASDEAVASLFSDENPHACTIM